jgi:hypothetical protein
VNQCRNNDCELRDRIAGDTICVVVQASIVHLLFTKIRHIGCDDAGQEFDLRPKEEKNFIELVRQYDVCADLADIKVATIKKILNLQQTW